jgi:hypothetical protein
MTKEMVAKMLNKTHWEPVESKHPSLANEKVDMLSERISGKISSFKGGVEKEKMNLKAKLPKGKKLEKLDLGSKFR